MGEIKIPVPNVKLSEIVKRKAKSTIDHYLTRSDLSNIAYQSSEYMDKLLSALIYEVATVKGANDKLLYFSEILIHLNALYQSISDPQSTTQNPTRDSTCLRNIEDLQYHYYTEISEMGFNIDSNSFTRSEASDIVDKVDEIIAKLTILQSGQEVLFDRIEEIKEDFKDVLSTVPLGKKPTMQRLVGIVAGYGVEKGADEVYSLLRSWIEHIIQETPNLIG